LTPVADVGPQTRTQGKRKQSDTPQFLGEVRARKYKYYIYIHLYKWHVCLGSYILEQEESRDIRKKGRVGEQGRGGN